MNEYYIKQYNISMRYQDFPGNECPILFIHGLGCAGSFDYPQVATQNKLKKHNIEKAAVLLKGSRGMRLEEIIEGN